MRIALVRQLLAISMVAVLLSYAANDAEGRAQDRGAQTRYRELIVQGERPELVSCLVAAEDSASKDQRFDAIRWELSVSRTAHMTESEAGGHLVRSVRVEGAARLRDSHSFFDSWQPVQIFCEQRDEATPTVRVEPILKQGAVTGTGLW